MILPADCDILFVSNGHGEDAIAGAILDHLAPDPDRRARIIAWPQVGRGRRYRDRGIATLGPEHHLPSEGFGTVSLKAFLKDLRAGFIGTYLAQARFARSLRGAPQVMVAIGDVIPLLAGHLSGMRTIFYSAPKSAHYGSQTGHDRLDRYLMARCEHVLVRDQLTAQRLSQSGTKAAFLGNPMMDWAEGTRDAALRPASKTIVALLAGSRSDAATNTATLLAGLSAATRPVHGLIAAHDGFDTGTFGDHLPNGWRASGQHLTHTAGATAQFVLHRFGDALASSDMAIGMAGTANEQAVGLGLPLIAVPGAGNQGAAFQAMKDRYFGRAAHPISAAPSAIGDAIDMLIADPERGAAMGQAGRALMGPPGGSAAIAKLIAQTAGWNAP